MGAIILVLIAVFALSESDQFTVNQTQSMTGSTATYIEGDDGDIGQIFGVSDPVSAPITVVVEAPGPGTTAKPVRCDQLTELVRDLTIPYKQRSYLRADGTACTPVE